MVLRTPRLTLREFTPDDTAGIYACQHDPRYLRYSPWDCRSEADAQALVQRFIDWRHESPRTRFQVAIELAESGEMIGNVGLRMPGDYTLIAEVGYELDPRCWGQGFATEAAAAMLQFGFEELGLRRVHSHCVAENVASARVMERLGMKLEGRQRQQEFFKGRWWDVLLYGILAPEWDARRQP